MENVKLGIIRDITLILPSERGRLEPLRQWQRWRRAIEKKETGSVFSNPNPRKLELSSVETTIVPYRGHIKDSFASRVSVIGRKLRIW